MTLIVSEFFNFQTPLQGTYKGNLRFPQTPSRGNRRFPLTPSLTVGERREPHREPPHLTPLLIGEYTVENGCRTEYRRE